MYAFKPCCSCLNFGKQASKINFQKVVIYKQEVEEPSQQFNDSYNLCTSLNSYRMLASLGYNMNDDKCIVKSFKTIAKFV